MSKGKNKDIHNLPKESRIQMLRVWLIYIGQNIIYLILSLKYIWSQLNILGLKDRRFLWQNKI